MGLTVRSPSRRLGLRVAVLGAMLAVLVGCGAEAQQVDTSSGTGENAAGTPEAAPPDPQGTGVVGQVSDPSGKPIELANLTVEPAPGGDGPVTQEANVTDVDGRYFLALPEGRWKVTITAFGYEPATVPVEVSDDTPAARDVVLQPAEG